MSLPQRLVVVGAGRVGSAMVRAAEAAGVPVTVVGRGGDGLAHVAPGAPIVVCTRADDLDEVLRAVPTLHRPHLVFVQNGMILPFLRDHGLAHATLGLIYFAATSRQGPIEPGAPSLFHGRHAAELVAVLDAAGIPAREVPRWEEFAKEIAVKLAWNIVFGLLGDTFDETVGETATRHHAEVEALGREVAPVLAAAVRAPVPADELVERLVAYSLGIPTFRAAVKELRWRNGWLAAFASRLGIATPKHDRLFRARPGA